MTIEAYKGMKLPLFGDLKMPPISGVYRITNNVTGDFYIGGTRDIRARQWSHAGKLLNGKHDSKALQKSFDQYGKDAFEISVIDVADSSHHAWRIESDLIAELKPAFNTSGTGKKKALPRRSYGKTFRPLFAPGEWKARFGKSKRASG